MGDVVILCAVCGRPEERFGHMSRSSHSGFVHDRSLGVHTRLPCIYAYIYIYIRGEREREFKISSNSILTCIRFSTAQILNSLSFALHHSSSIPAFKKSLKLTVFKPV